MISRTFAVFASLAALAYASPACIPRPSTTVSGDPPTATPTLPSTGAVDLPAPVNVTLVKIAVGHGLQNYTCANSSASVVSAGALAVLYDVTAHYPGTPGTGLSQEAWDNLTSTILWNTPLPLNLQDPAAAAPGTPSNPNVLVESDYGAVVANPFPPPAPVPVPGVGPLSFLGHHYFDAASTPTFDLLSTTGMFLSAAKTGDVKAPTTADKGILSTGAVDWLQLKDNGKGISQGLSLVYRVVTAGGSAEACSVSGAGAGSVPYAAFYWFYEPAS